MTHPNYYFRFDYRPVGQGLFAAGMIWSSHDQWPDFTWVYDCGSSDSPAALEREIERLKLELIGRNIIDVLILSHFDRDHINGVKELLKHFKVNRLFIPYVPLEKRLLLLFKEPVRNHAFVEAVMNPARHLAEAGGEKLIQIISLLSKTAI